MKNEMFVDDDDEEPYESSSDYDDSSDDENNASYTPTLILSQSDDAEEKMDSEIAMKTKLKKIWIQMILQTLLIQVRTIC